MKKDQFNNKSSINKLSLDKLKDSNATPMPLINLVQTSQDSSPMPNLALPTTSPINAAAPFKCNKKMPAPIIKPQVLPQALIKEDLFEIPKNAANDDQPHVQRRFQKANKYDRLLPYYSTNLKREAAEYWGVAKLGLAQALCWGRIRPQFAHWCKQIHEYTLRHGLRFEASDHVVILNALYELITRADLDADILMIATEIAIELLKRPDNLARRAGSDGSIPVLELDYRGLMRRYETVVFAEESRNAAAYDLLRTPKKFGPHLNGLVKAARVYFQPGSAQSILAQLLGSACPLDPVRMEQVCHLLELFTPTRYGDNEEFQREMGQSYANRLLDLISKHETFPPWHRHLISLLARLAQDNVGRCSWTEHDIDAVLGKFLVHLNLPLANKSIGHRGAQCKIPTQDTARFLVNAMAGQTEKDGLLSGPPDQVQPRLSSLLLAIQSYVHPSNSGKWTGILVKFVNALVSHLMSRLFLERHKIWKWGQPIPQAAKLTDGQVEKFVAALKPIVFMLMFDKQAYRNITFAIKDMVSLSPTTMIPSLMDKMYLSFETLLEPHRLRSCLAVGSVLGLALTRLQPFARPADSDDSESSLGPCHLMAVLDYALLGIDPNDPVKCTSSLLMICTLLCHVPMYQPHQTSLPDPSSNQSDSNWELERQELIASSSATFFSDFAVRLLERCLDLAAALDNSSVDAGGFLLATASAREDVGGTGVIKSRDEASLSLAMMGAVNTVLRQCSPAIYVDVITFGLERVKRTLHASKAARDTVADLCHGMCLPDPTASLPILAPHLLARVADQLLHTSGPSSTADPELLWSLEILGSAFKNSGSSDEILLYARNLLNVVGPGLDPVSNPHLAPEAYEMACEVVSRVLASITRTYVADYRSLNPAEWEAYVVKGTRTTKPLDLWGRTYSFKEVDISWHVPNAAGLSFALDLLDTYMRPSLDYLDSLTTANTVGNNLNKSILHKHLCVVEKLLAGASAILPALPPALNNTSDTVENRLLFGSDPLLTQIRSKYEGLSYPELSCVATDSRFAWVRPRVVASIHSLLRGCLSAELSHDYVSLGHAVQIYRLALFHRGHTFEEVEMRCQNYKNIKMYSTDRFHFPKRLPRFAHALRAQIQHELYSCQPLDRGFETLPGPGFWQTHILQDLVSLALDTEYKVVREMSISLLDHIMASWPVISHTIIMELILSRATSAERLNDMEVDVGLVEMADNSTKIENFTETVLKLVMGRTPENCMTGLGYFGLLERTYQLLFQLQLPDKQSLVDLWDAAIDQIVCEAPIHTKRLLRLPATALRWAAKLAKTLNFDESEIAVPEQTWLASRLSQFPVYDPVFIPPTHPCLNDRDSDGGCSYYYYKIFEDAPAICENMRSSVSSQLYGVSSLVPHQQSRNWRFRFMAGQMLASLIIVTRTPLDPDCLRHVLRSCKQSSDSPQIKALYLCQACTFLRLCKLPYRKIVYVKPLGMGWAQALCYPPVLPLTSDMTEKQTPFSHKTSVGYYYVVSSESLASPQTLEVLDPNLVTIPFDYVSRDFVPRDVLSSFDGLSELRHVAAAQFSAPHHVTAFVRELADAEDTDIDFDPVRVNFFKALFRDQGPELTSVFLDFLLAKFIPVQDATVGIKGPSLPLSLHCVAAEIFAGWVRATKYWTSEQRDQSFSRYREFIDRGILDRITPETNKFWNAAFSMCGQARDPRSIAPLIEIFVDRIESSARGVIAGSGGVSQGSSLNASLAIKLAYDFLSLFRWKIGTVHAKLASRAGFYTTEYGLGASGSKNIEGAVGQLIALPFTLNQYSVDSFFGDSTESETVQPGTNDLGKDWWREPKFDDYFDNYVAAAIVSYVKNSLTTTSIQINAPSSESATASQNNALPRPSEIHSYVSGISSLLGIEDAVTSLVPDSELVENRLRTYVKVVNTYIQQSLNPLSRPILLSLPLLFHMEKILETRDPHWSREISNILLFISRCQLAPPRNTSEVPVVLKVLARCFTSNPVWKVRVTVLVYLRDTAFNNLFALAPWAGVVWNFCLAALLDPVLEVGEKGGEALSGLLQCSYLPFHAPALIARFNRLIEFGNTPKSEALNSARAFVHRVLLGVCASEKDPLLRVEGEPHNVASEFYDSADALDSLGLLRGAIERGDQGNQNTRTRFYSAGLRGLCALVQAFPYQIPSELPAILIRLSALSAHKNSGRYGGLIRKTMANFKRTHLDNWHQEHKAKFTEEELEVLSDLLISPNYYA